MVVMVALFSLVSLSYSYVPAYDSLGGESHFSSSNEGFGPTNYTDEHTYVTVGYEGRYTQLRMPGGHDYSKPLPLVVSLHGFSGNGQSNAEYMHLFDSIHENEHLLLYPDGTQNWVGHYS